MPAPIVLSTLTPETKKVVNPPTGQPVIATKAELRDGSRPTGGGGGGANWLSHSQVSRAPAPLLRFTDLVNGPAYGINDGLGSGAIVTVWAQGIGDSQGTSKAHFTDFAGTKRECYVYYWKRADGELPGGPARLWSSHLMQEVAISIPAGSVNGAGTITLEVNGVTSNTLPFLVRGGSIYHVKSTGSDSNDGSWASPYLTHDAAINAAPAGALIYLHDVATGTNETPLSRGFYWNNLSSSSSQDAQMCSTAYPGERPQVIAQMGAAARTNEGWVISKIAFYCSSYTAVDENDQPIGNRIEDTPSDTYCTKPASLGRIIANKMTDILDGCASAMNGAIVAGNMNGNDTKIYGNEIHEYGCAGTSKFHHTTYMSIRQDINTQVKAWEFGFNFLWGNPSKNGLHNYDQPSSKSGTLITDLKIHHNVICEQGGAGVNVATNTGWNIGVYVENNVVIDSGRASEWDGLDPDTSNAPLRAAIALKDGTPDGLPSIIHVRNNLTYKYAEQWEAADYQNDQGALVVNGEADLMDARWNNNIAVSVRDTHFFFDSSDGEVQTNNVTGSNNIWYHPESSPVYATSPSWSQASLSSDPQITLDGAIVTLAATSPAKGASNNLVPAYTHDIYGVPRPATYTIGPVEAN